MKLNEGAKISKQLVNAALNNPEITFGFEAEFFYKGIDDFITKYMTKDSELDESEGWHVKALGDTRWHDVMMFFYPMSVTTDTQQDNTEIMRLRLMTEWEDITEYDADDHDGKWPTPSEMFAQLRSEMKMPTIMALLQIYPYHGMVLSEPQERSIKAVIQRGDVEKASTLSKLENFKYRTYQEGWEQQAFHIKNGDENIREVFYEIFAFQLERYLGEKVEYASSGDTHNQEYDHWVVVPDDSLTAVERYSPNFIGIEIISPVMQLATGLEYMQAIFAIIDDPGLLGFENLSGSTTYDTGFHINLGINNIHKMDYLKLILLMGDHNAVAQYGREFSDAAASILPQAITDIKSYVKMYPNKVIQLINQLVSKVGTSQADINNAIKALSAVIPKDKNHSVNLTKLPSGYVEFRHAGGENYHKDFDKVRKSVLSFATWLYVATNDEIYKKEYYMALFKLLQTIKTGESEYLPDDFTQQLDKLRNESGDEENILDSIGATPNIGPTGRQGMEPTGYMDSMWVPTPDNYDGHHPGNSEDDSELP